MSSQVLTSNATLRSEPMAYTKVAVTMHWLIALLIFLNVVVGVYMDSLPKTDPRHDSALFYHASFGSLIFMLAVFRLFWRSTHKPPSLPVTIPSWQRAIAHTLHWVLYSLMFAVPFTGYLHRMAGGHPVSFFGLGYLPVIIGKNEPLRLLTDTLHVCLVWVLCILVVGHIGAALKHRFIDRDGVIQRMLRV